MAGLTVLILLPLAIIAAQIVCGASGAVANSSYKLALIVPPLLYCRAQGIDISHQVFKWQNWRNGLGLALTLGFAAAGIFLVAYWTVGGLLIDRTVVTAKIQAQFGVEASTVLLIAPVTIVINSLVEEFFYRGFAFGLLVRKNMPLGMILPAIVFTVQHLLFIYHWVSAFPLSLAVVSLVVFAFTLQAVYAKTDSIVAPWLIHICGDIAMMAIAMELVFEQAPVAAIHG